MFYVLTWILASRGEVKFIGLDWKFNWVPSKMGPGKKRKKVSDTKSLESRPPLKFPSWYCFVRNLCYPQIRGPICVPVLSWELCQQNDNKDNKSWWKARFCWKWDPPWPCAKSGIRWSGVQGIISVWSILIQHLKCYFEKDSLLQAILAAWKSLASRNCVWLFFFFFSPTFSYYWTVKWAGTPEGTFPKSYGFISRIQLVKSP